MKLHTQEDIRNMVREKFPKKSDVAERLGMSTEHFSRWLNDKQELSAKKLNDVVIWLNEQQD